MKRQATVHRTAVSNPPAASSIPSPLQIRALLVVILATAAFLRFYQLPTFPEGIQIDEAMNGSNILQILETGEFHIFYPENMGREGLFINLQAVASSVLGNEPWVLRTVSATFGVLTVWTTYLLVTELFSPIVGLLSSFLVATSFWHLMLSRMATRAIAAPFFFTLSMYLLISAMRLTRSGQPFIRRMLAAGAVYGLGFHTYTAFRVSPAVFGLVLLYYFFASRKERWTASFWKGSLIFVAAAFVVVLPLVMYFIGHPAAAAGRASQVLVFNRAQNPAMEIASNVWKTAQMFFFEGDHSGRHNYNARAELFLPAAILFALGAGAALASVMGAIRKATLTRPVCTYALLLGWIAVAAIPAILSGEGVPHALRSSLMIPAVFALAAVGGEYAWNWSRGALPAAARTSVLAAFVLLMIYDPYHTYFDLWANHPDTPGHYSMPLVRLAEEYNRLPASMPRYIAVTATGPSANGIPVLLMPFTYLTRSYTEKEQQATNIRYITPQNLIVPPGTDVKTRSFCQVAQAAVAGAPFTCLNLRY
jgi:4-amino-4-deoxy-L-arabinose transferase-like glycosyltransferase